MTRLSDDLTAAFPFLGEMPPRTREELFAQSVRKRLDHKQILASEGRDCTHLPFVVSGTLRVYKLAESGKELTLYRIERGESCILTATCILNGNLFSAIAEAEGSVDVVLVPSALFVRLVESSPEWRRYVFGLYSRRLEVLLAVVDEVAFRHVDARIAAHLLSIARHPSRRAETTHQQIASEVGTSREVVSRILKDFESDGVISIARGEVAILRAQRLREIAGNLSSM